jgi:flagellum-specific ATP synthase
MAQREIGLAVGEPPATRGYTPSVFALLPRIFERAGTAETGSITALYTVLVDGDDHEEPVADAIRSILDGHIVLSRDIAAKGHYPAIDILRSVSRCMPDVASREHVVAARELVALMAVYRESEDLVTLGAYQKGSNARLDLAIRLRGVLDTYLRQDRTDGSSFEQAVGALLMLAREAGAAR